MILNSFQRGHVLALVVAFVALAICPKVLMADSGTLLVLNKSDSTVSLI